MNKKAKKENMGKVVQEGSSLSPKNWKTRPRSSAGALGKGPRSVLGLPTCGLLVRAQRGSRTGCPLTSCERRLGMAGGGRHICAVMGLLGSNENVWKDNQDTASKSGSQLRTEQRGCVHPVPSLDTYYRGPGLRGQSQRHPAPAPSPAPPTCLLP